MVIVKVLGSAQDAGVPHPGCYCPRCEAARRNPGQRRTAASVAVVDRDQGFAYLVDAGPDLRGQLDRLDRFFTGTPRWGKLPVDRVFLTHAHMGHYPGLIYFGRESCSTNRLLVYCTIQMAAFLRANRPFAHLVEREEIVLHEIHPDQPLDLPGGVCLIPFQVPHRNEDADTVGYTIVGPDRRLVYLPDLDCYTDAVVARIQEADLALLDGSFYRPGDIQNRDFNRIGHPPMEETVARFQDTPVEIIFTHFNHTNPVLDEPSAIRDHLLERGFRIASEGMEIALGASR